MTQKPVSTVEVQTDFDINFETASEEAQEEKHVTSI